MTTNSVLASKLWNYCNPATRDDDGLSYGEYVEQLMPLCGGHWLMQSSKAESRARQTAGRRFYFVQIWPTAAGCRAYFCALCAFLRQNIPFFFVPSRHSPRVVNLRGGIFKSSGETPLPLCMHNLRQSA